MTKQLYYGSLEQHMRQYMKDVKLNQLNNDYQLAQQAIVKEGEEMQLSRAEIQNKIEMMKQTLKDNIAKKLLPKEPPQTVDQDTQIKRAVKNVMNSMLSGLEKKNSMLSELEKRVASPNLKKTKPKEIETKEAPMVKALREAEGKPSKAKSQRKKPIASIASTAPTESDSTTVNPSGSPRDIGTVTFAELKSESYKRLTDYLRSGKITDSQWTQFNKEVKDIGGTGASARLNTYMDGLLQQYGSGLHKRKSKKK